MSSFKKIINDHIVSNTAVAGNGVFNVYVSEKIESPKDYPADDRAMEMIIVYEDNLPDPENSIAKYNLSAVIETEDDSGKWHPIMNQYTPFVKAENGNRHILRVDPGMLILDPGYAIENYSGDSVVSIDSNKQIRMPNDFRLVIQVNEYGYDGEAETAASFKQVTVSASYRTY